MMVNRKISNFGNVTNYGDGIINQGEMRITHNHDAGLGHSPTPRENLAAIEAEPSRNVFVVYGRDSQVRDEMFDLLRRLDLRPLEWEALVHSTREGSPFLGRVIADAPSLARAAVVLLTPDDVVMLHPELRSRHEDRFELRPALQPRPNVVLELGMVLALYPRNTVIVEFGDLRPIADLGGRNVIRFNEGVSLTEALKKISGRLKTAGCLIDDSGTDWLDIRPFSGMKAYRRAPT